MTTISPYLRVVAGFFGGLFVWMAVLDAIHGDIGSVWLDLVFAAGLGYLAVGKPIRQHIARVKAENAAIVARAEAANAAFMAGDIDAALAPPPLPPAPPPVRRGVVVAALIAAGLLVFGIITDITGGLDKSADDQSPPSTQSVP